MFDIIQHVQHCSGHGQRTVSTRSQCPYAARDRHWAESDAATRVALRQDLLANLASGGAVL